MPPVKKRNRVWSVQSPTVEYWREKTYAPSRYTSTAKDALIAVRNSSARVSRYPSPSVSTEVAVASRALSTIDRVPLEYVVRNSSHWLSTLNASAEYCGSPPVAGKNREMPCACAAWTLLYGVGLS